MHQTGIRIDTDVCFQSGMRVLIQGRSVMDELTKDCEEFSALKVQASRVAVLPRWVEALSYGPT
jgi:single-strand DNA-binding protein